MSAILQLLDKMQIRYKKAGNNYICRCPFCKGDNELSKHNAQINETTNSLYCHSEGKLYPFISLLKLVREDIDPDEIRKKIKESAKENTEKTRRQQAKKFDTVEASLEEKGYRKTAFYPYRTPAGEFVYGKFRFQKSGDGEKDEKVIIPYSQGTEGEGYASLMGRRQIPYCLEQFGIFADPDEIWLCEGEKCTDALLAEMPGHANLVVLGFCKPSDFRGFEQLFEGKNIVIFEDNDETGKKNTKDLIEIFSNIAMTVRVVRFTDKTQGYDVADFLEEHDWNDLIKKIIEAEVVYKSPFLSVIRGSDTIEDDEEKEFILEPFIPSRGIVLFDGLGETGKSILAMQMGLCISDNIPFFGITPEVAGPVLYITAEETKQTFYKRLKKIQTGTGTTGENFYWLSILSKDFTCDTYRILSKDRGVIEKTKFYDYLKTLIRHINPVLVVLDSLINFYSLDENSSEHASVFIETLKMLIKEQNTEISFLLLHHQTKEAMKQDGNKVFRGSTVFREQSRCRFYIQKEDDIRKKILIEKLNIYTECQREYDVVLSTITETGEPCLAYIPVPVVVSRIPDNAISTNNNDDADDDDTDMVISDNDLI